MCFGNRKRLIIHLNGILLETNKNILIVIRLIVTKLLYPLYLKQ